MILHLCLYIYIILKLSLIVNAIDDLSDKWYYVTMDKIIQLDIYSDNYKEILAGIYRAQTSSIIDINYNYRQHTALDKTLLFLHNCNYLIRLQDRYTYSKVLDCLNYYNLICLHQYYEHLQKHKIYNRNCKNTSFLTYANYKKKNLNYITNNYLDNCTLVRYNDIVTARQRIFQLTKKE
jgi:hypothetical protein